MDDPLTRQLTDAQREAVLHFEGPLLVLAGPGSGKTRVITHRVANLLRQGVAARQILALTFTNKAADEMKARVEHLAPGRPVWISTFHRFCARLLRDHAELAGLQPNYTIYDTSDSLGALKRAIEQLDYDPGHYTPQQIASGISWAKNNLMTAENYQPWSGNALGSVVAKVYPAYAANLLKSNAVDFDDLLLHVATLLRESTELRAELDARYRFILVDEYQDTNLAQYAIVRAMSLDQPNLAVTGDPDQSIYGWRGANLNNILEFEHDYPDVHVVRLEQNYRSTKSILRVAATLIAHNRKRKEKGLFTDNDEGVPVRLMTYATERDEAESIARQIADAVHGGQRSPRDFAIFYRINALSRALEFALRDQGIPYQIVRGVEFYQRKEIKDVMAYLILLNNPRDDAAFLRVINAPARGIGKTSLTRLAEHAVRRGLTLFEAARESGIVEAMPKKAAVSFAKFVALIDRLNLIVLKPVEEVLGHVLAESGYRDALVASEAEEDQERLANIEELLTAARQFDEHTPGEGHLEEFLEQVCLVNDTDAWETETDRVTLMTLHASKGLEFPVIFLTALEEGLLPHERSREKPEQLEEERRLLFVGITRAKEELQLSRATYREFRGRRKMTVPSQFMMELPLDELESHQIGATYIFEQATAAHDESVHEDGGDEAWAAGGAGDSDDLSWDVEALEQESKQPEPRRAGAAALTTAAELAAGPRESLPAVSPDEFALGMVVRHPEYGLGKIVALSGGHSARKATVQFSGEATQRTFVLHLSPLRPVRSSG